MTKTLLLVAHPDDELLFAGGLMMAHPEVEWHVWTATYKTTDPRGRARAKALDALALRGVSFGPSPMLGLPDDGPYVLTLERRNSWRTVVAMHLDDFKPDRVVTHNRLGEYGHPHHMALNNIAHELFDCPIWSFYCTAPSGVGEQERLSCMYEVPLDGGYGLAKHAIMQEAYPDEYVGLKSNQPELIDWAFGATETFTSDRGWS